MPELLMPAGDLEKTKIAYQYGADACYGSTSAFSMRTREIGFDYKTLKEAVDYAHSIGKKFYITCNIYPHEFEINKIITHIKKLISMEPDAIIVADPGILQIITKELKNQGIKKSEIEIHLSTQANATNSEAIKFWGRQGVSRVILPRELSLKEIVEIRIKVPKKILLEAFVHGAMCNSVSGRCNLSNYLSYRDANRGACVQPCRWKYSLIEEKRPNQYIPVDEDGEGSYIYNSKDLNMIEHLAELKKAGIESFKIEGRNKSIYYCAIVARAYRKAIDNMGKSRNQGIKELKKELETVTNRGYSTGFYFGKPTDTDINYKSSRPSSDWQFVGIVKEASSYKLAANSYLIEARNETKPGDTLEIVVPDEIYKIKIEEFITPEGTMLEKANPNDKYIIKFNRVLPINSMLRKKDN